MRLLDLKEETDRVSWRALTELVAPDGRTVLEEEQAVACTPQNRLMPIGSISTCCCEPRTRREVWQVPASAAWPCGCPGNKAAPPHLHLNATGLRGRDCEQKRAAWCSVERPFGDHIFGIAVFDHPSNPNHPSGWRVDEQG